MVGPWRSLACVLFLRGAAGLVDDLACGGGTCDDILKLPPSYEADLYLAKADAEPQDLLRALAKSNLTEVKYLRTFAPPPNSKGEALGAKFRNFRRGAIEMRWDDRSAAGMYSGEIPGLGRTSTLSYVGHTFFFLDKASRTEVARFTMESGVNFYIIEPTAGEAETLASPLYVAALAEAAFMADYSKRTGTPWLSAYGRGRPVLNMWPADNLPGDLALQLTVLSHAPQGPRAFVVKNLLSDFECDHIIELGKSVVKPSLVGQLGGFKSKTRSSENGWLSRSASPVLENMYLRFADVLGLDEKQLNAKANAEELQVVRYRGAQEYAPHHDFGDDGLPEQRFLTLLLYIQLPAAGGATSFPKAAGGRGISVVPARGDAILFYNMLPDGAPPRPCKITRDAPRRAKTTRLGNGDDLALHAGMPVLDGEKWVCNLWIWDPVR